MFKRQEDRRSEPVQRIVALGESTTWGYSVSSKDKCWVNQVVRMLQESQGSEIELINQGIGSNVLTPDCPAYEFSAKPSALERVDGDLIAYRPDMVFLSYGLNDSRGGTPPEVFRRAYQELIDRIRAAIDPLIVLVNTYYMHEVLYDHCEHWEESSYALTEVYNLVIEQLAEANDLILADVYAAEVGVDWIIDEDHCHPNDLGHRLIANRVFEAIVRNCSFVACQMPKETLIEHFGSRHGNGPDKPSWRSNIVIRRPVADDIHQTLALLLRCKIPEYGLEGLRQEWNEMDLTEDAWLAFSGTDNLVGYATVTPYQAGLCYHVYVDPVWEGTALNRMLLQACDRRAKARIASRAGPGETIVTTWIAHGSERDRQAVEEAGFCLVKRSFEMLIEMEHRPPEPRWPEGIWVRSAVPVQDDSAICRLMAAAFAGTHLEPSDFAEWRDAMIGGAYFDADLWFLALHKEAIVGACLCAVYPEQQQAWVRQLGVAADWRRRGIARALLLHAFRAFYGRGHQAVRLGVEADTIAYRLYEQVGMRCVRQFDEYQQRIG